jgi:hypothetical protein
MPSLSSKRNSAPVVGAFAAYLIFEISRWRESREFVSILKPSAGIT